MELPLLRRGLELLLRLVWVVPLVRWQNLSQGEVDLWRVLLDQRLYNAVEPRVVLVSARYLQGVRPRSRIVAPLRVCREELCRRAERAVLLVEVDLA